MLSSVTARLRHLEVRTRPEHPDLTAALARRWDELPAHVKTPNQMLGKRTAGCEGTHGVFPRCNLACTPCYHSKDANRVRTDGEHTQREVDAQMAYLREQRGPGQNAQLIGGEVSLLSPDDHFAALDAMIRHGRKPMSMSHGDFDYDYLEALALNPRTGKPRVKHLSFAGHFDSMMFGRRGIKRVETEAQLHPHRRRFCEMFQRLEREHGVTHYLAHNMTVTPRNLGQVAEVVRTNLDAGFGMFSFQPAAYVGNPARWNEEFEAVTIDNVWAQLEAAVGRRLPWEHLQVGDPRCNRSAYGVVAGGRWFPLLEDGDARDLRVRDVFLARLGGMDFERPRLPLALALARVVARAPQIVPLAAGWGLRFARRAGVRRLLRGRPLPVTFVVHAFMDAAVVAPAWAAMERGEVADDPDVRAAQERLAACSYAMAHPDSGRTVPACVQHSVLDAQENRELLQLLPMAAGT